MSWYWFVAIMLGAYVAMEFVAWATHKYVMHGFLWSLHRDHHVKDPGFFERNDSFFLIFAVPGSSTIIWGSTQAQWYFVAIGLGITLYGLTYFLIHEVFIHQRFKWFRNTQSAYLNAIRRAHKMHHKHLTKHDGENFGLLVVPWRYYRKERQKLKQQTS